MSSFGVSGSEDRGPARYGSLGGSSQRLLLHHCLQREDNGGPKGVAGEHRRPKETRDYVRKVCGPV